MDRQQNTINTEISQGEPCASGNISSWKAHISSHTGLLVRGWIVLGTCADIWTKYVFCGTQHDTAKTALCIRNHGASWGITMPLIFLHIILYGALVVFVYLWKTKKISSRSFIFLMIGSIGNGVDRISFGAVRDWIIFPQIAGWQFPLFNIADSALTIGCVILAYEIWYKKTSCKK